MKNLKGKVFGRLKAIEPVGRNKSRGIIWLCECACGKYSEVDMSSLTRGLTKSCGCLAKETTSKKMKTHGQSNSLEYRSWQAMKARVLNNNAKNFKNYGGRGIKVCKRWMKFENFYKDMGEIPKGYSLDRIDNDGNYCPENCRWATKLEQSNNRRDNKFLEYKGKTQTIAEWVMELGLNSNSLRTRLRRGWSVEKSFETPFKI